MMSTAATAEWLAGFIPDLPTPFNPRGEIDPEAFGRLCERQIAAGATALVVGETAGESPTLEHAERERLIRIAARVARHQVPIIAGSGSNATDRAVTFTRAAEAAGADAIMSVVPYYNKPMPAGIAAHFRAVAAATSLPVILHDIPSRTVKGLADDTLLELAHTSGFIGLCDGNGDTSRLTRLRGHLPTTFRMLTGNDAASLAWLAAGGDGCISTVSNVAPDLCAAITRHLRAGRLHPARELHQLLAPLAALLEREHPAALKCALALLGFMQPAARLPIVQLDQSAKREVAQALAALADEYLATPDTRKMPAAG